jgi:D-lactate dehydrogenase (cytochrome)
VQIKYGTMRTNVLGLTAVMADGRILKTGGRARKSSSGGERGRGSIRVP